MTQQKQIMRTIDQLVSKLINVVNVIKEKKITVNQLDKKIKKIEYIQSKINDAKNNDILWQLKFCNKRLKSLIERYEFVVLVYGMVKAGKSDLGNFMAGVPIKQLKKEGLLKEPSLYDKIDISIEVWKDGKKQIEKEFMEFEEDAVEATNRIQVFRLGGLTWVDTPGTGSMTRENAKIAQEFIDNADLIVFLTSSENPLRKQDIEEIKQLHFKEKPWLIVISKSDTTNKDEVDGKIVTKRVAKSSKDRKDQEYYVLETIKEKELNQHLQNTKAISISVALAKDSLKTGDYKLFQDSNIPLFYEELCKIFEKKIDTLDMLDEIISSLNPMLDDYLSDTFFVTRLQSISEQLEPIDLKKIDKIRANLPEYPEKIFYDVNKGSWEVYRRAFEIQDGYEIELDRPLVARNPEADIKDGIVAIDFGTKSTVVVGQDETEEILPFRVGMGNWNEKEQPEHVYPAETVPPQPRPRARHQ
jgi:ATP phosphoribosyltransferase